MAQPISEFDAWFDQTISDAASPDINGGLRSWFKTLWEDNPTITNDDARAAYVQAQIAIAQVAIDNVTADLHRTTSFRPEISIDAHDGPCASHSEKTSQGHP